MSELPEKENETPVEVITELKDIRGLQSGMHPGVIAGHRQFEKANTSKPRSKARMQRALDGWDRHIENHPRDVMAQKCRANLKERMSGISG